MLPEQFTHETNSEYQMSICWSDWVVATEFFPTIKGGWIKKKKAPWHKMAIHVTFYGMHASPCFFHTNTTVSDAMYRQQNTIPIRNNLQCVGKNMAECHASKCAI